MSNEPTWNRRQLWAEDDARRARSARAHSFVVLVVLIVGWLGLSIASYWSHTVYRVDHAIRAQTAAPAECYVDDDCLLMPSLLTCCGECPAISPFEAIPRALFGELMQELDESCAPRTRLCDPPVCAGEREDCAARALCRHGRCEAFAPPSCTRP